MATQNAKGPTLISTEDIFKLDTAKLHNEINNYVNHQYLIYTGGLTLVGVVIAWVSQQARVGDFRTLGVAYIGCSVVLIFLALLNLLDFRLEIAREICANYLRLTATSNWEMEIEAYKAKSPSKRWLAVTSRHGYYTILGAIAAAWPALIAIIVFGATRMSFLSTAHLLISILYGTFVLMFMPRFLVRCRAEIEETWKAALARPGANRS